MNSEGLTQGRFHFVWTFPLRDECNHLVQCKKKNNNNNKQTKNKKKPNKQDLLFNCAFLGAETGGKRKLNTHFWGSFGSFFLRFFGVFGFLATVMGGAGDAISAAPLFKPF